MAINEAVELAKSFGGTDGHKYVNGVLDKAAADLRAARSPGPALSAATPGPGMKLASRLDHIDPFYVMECAKAAAELARSPACADSPMIFLNIGEPDFTAPPAVLAAARRCMDGGRTHYTQATGEPALRERISRWYARALRPGPCRRSASSSPPARRPRCNSPAWRSSSAATRC